MIGSDRLMQAREFYAPTTATLSPEVDFARWTQRIAVQSEVGSAREMAGLTDAQLDVLSNEFMRHPNRPRPAWARHGLWVGGFLIVLAFAALAMSGMSAVDPDATRALTAFGLVLLLVGSCCMAVSCLKSFGGMHLDLNYGTTGLYVGVLDEQHPWLYKACSLLRDEVAESYRESVLRERGRLRGLDYVMMRELVAAHESMERLRPARAVAEQLQSHPDRLEAPAAEPRLVQLGVAATPRERGTIQIEAA